MRLMYASVYKLTELYKAFRHFLTAINTKKRSGFCCKKKGLSDFLASSSS